VLYATTMALFHRECTGEGQEVEVGMFETMASFMLVEHANGALFSPSLGPAHYPRVVSRNRRPFRTKDGYLSALVYNDKHWASFVEVVRPRYRAPGRRATARLHRHSGRRTRVGTSGGARVLRRHPRVACGTSGRCGQLQSRAPIACTT
jgi:crotonobetainyl-CoA:carnitine CoA-transferase CaiB-like acyl-CoA transferase